MANCSMSAAYSDERKGPGVGKHPISNRIREKVIQVFLMKTRLFSFKTKTGLWFYACSFLISFANLIQRNLLFIYLFLL